MNPQAALQSLLRRKLTELQARNPAYSLRSFARKLGISPPAVSEYLRGRRAASRSMAEKLAVRMLLDPQEKHELLRHFPERPRRSTAVRNVETTDADYLRLSSDQFQIISEWVHFGLLSLMKTSDFRGDPEWMASRLGVSIAKIVKSLDRLERAGLIGRDPTVGWKRLYGKLHTTDDVFDLSLQKAHLGDLEIARNALQEVPVQSRDFTSITVPASPKLIGPAKEAIRKFREEMGKLLESEPGTEVYQLTVYLYPLTRLAGSHEIPRSP